MGKSEAKTLAIVDPLDGSSNFERGIPFYCTSVAVAEGETVDDISVGVVRDLVNGDVYHARKGEGARKNGRFIGTSANSDLSRGVVGVDISRSTPGLVAGLGLLVSSIKRQVHLGANALELCYLADGAIGAVGDVRGKIRIAAVAAAYLIATEAGATVTDTFGMKPAPRFDLDHRFSFVGAANPTLHREILRLCRTPGGRRR